MLDVVCVIGHRNDDAGPCPLYPRPGMHPDEDEEMGITGGEGAWKPMKTS